MGTRYRKELVDLNNPKEYEIVVNLWLDSEIPHETTAERLLYNHLLSEKFKSKEAKRKLEGKLSN